MCAIFGILGSFEEERARAAFEILAHRGPDDRGIARGDRYWLGVHRLAIESAGAPISQPLEDAGEILLFNGEIYNYRALAEELGIPGADEARTLLEAWRCWGDGFVERLRGMYAIALYTPRSRTLRLYRDPVGKKPLYYLAGEGVFAFASEAKALYLLKPFHLQRRHIPQYLGYQSTVAPETLDRELRKLEPGESLRIEIDPRDGGWKMEDGRWGKEHSQSVYDPWLRGPILYREEGRAVSALREALREAVEIRIPQKVEWGVLLSGGLDSSAVAALASRSAGSPIRTYSIGYEGYAKYDERAWARKTAEHLGAEHREYAFGKREFFETLERWVDLLDEPLGDPAAVPLLYLMERAAGEGARVLLGGEGSDELLLGYWTYRRFYEYESLGGLPDASWLSAYLRRHPSLNREWEWYRRLAEGEVLFRSTAELYTELQLRRLLRLNLKDGENYRPIARYRERFEASGRRHPADWYSYLDLKLMLSEVYLVKQDRVSMAVGVEARSPFLDRRVIETVFAIDPDLRMRSAPKGLLKEAVRDLLPGEIVGRKKKGLNYPFVEWILAEDGIGTILEVQERTGLFRREQLEFLSQKADRGRFRQHLFPLYILARWLLKRI